MKKSGTPEQTCPIFAFQKQGYFEKDPIHGKKCAFRSNETAAESLCSAALRTAVYLLQVSIASNNAATFSGGVSGMMLLLGA